MKPKVTERGWLDHARFFGMSKCLFRRNTLIEGESDRVVVSTVGNLDFRTGRGMEPIGDFKRYYETRVFGVISDGPYLRANTTDVRSFDSPWEIAARSPKVLPDDVENQADEMHDAVVAEMVKKLSSKESKERRNENV